MLVSYFSHSHSEPELPHYVILRERERPKDLGFRDQENLQSENEILRHSDGVIQPGQISSE